MPIRVDSCSVFFRFTDSDAAQARNLGQTCAVPLESSEPQAGKAQKADVFNHFLAFLVFPMMLAALAVKSILLATSRMRRMFISE